MKAVIFDMDGVIVDSEPLHITHLHEFLRSIGVARPDTFTRNLKGVSAYDTWRMLNETFELKHDIDELIVRSRESYVQYLQNLESLPVIPGALTLIKYLKRSGYRLALASSAAPARIDMFLSKLKLKSYFENVVSGDDVERSKPAPDIFLLAAHNLGAKPTECVVIEDAENGVQAAKAAGMRCIAYGGSLHNTDNLLEADLIVKDFGKLVKSMRTGL
ncbi:MAG TPA: HAD family phosphatase, partial [Nitrococcus sp.]|nr:HAD family phosphatase [Nitrococcus sp.]